MNGALIGIIAEARKCFEQILAYVSNDFTIQQIHEVEESIYKQLMPLGKRLLEVFVTGQGTGNMGQVHQDSHGQKRDFHSNRTRQYVSIFGEVKITRAYYWRQGKEGICPLDAKLNLPQNSHSYVLEKWVGILTAHGAYGEGREILERLTGVKIWNESIERMAERGSVQTEEFYDERQPSQLEEKELLVFSVDGKGIPMKKEEPVKKKKRLKKGEKPGKKKMSIVTAVYTVERSVRTAKDIVEDIAKEPKSGNNNPKEARPKPQNKIVRATLKGKEAGFEALEKEVKRRDPEGKKEKVALVDGEKKLRRLTKVFFTSACIVLDIFHVLEYLWRAAHVFYSEGSDEAETWARGMLFALLEGKVEEIIFYLRHCLQEKQLSSARKNTIKKVIGYLENGKDCMKYDEYIAKGYPIGSGVVEGACRNLVKDRMERSGMHWTESGAEVVLNIRSIELNGLLDDYWKFRVVSEHKRLHQSYSEEDCLLWAA